jgi:hypothetical protein
MTSREFSSQVKPNYSLSCRDVYMNAVLAHINLTNRLEVLSLCGQCGRDATWASWIPDYVQRRRYGEIFSLSRASEFGCEFGWPRIRGRCLGGAISHWLTALGASGHIENLPYTSYIFTERCTLMRCTPVTFMLMRYTLMRCTPVRYTPIPCTGNTSSSLGRICLPGKPHLKFRG